MFCGTKRKQPHNPKARFHLLPELGCEVLRCRLVDKGYELFRPSFIVKELTAVSHCEIGVVGRDEKENEVEPHDQRDNSRP